MVGPAGAAPWEQPHRNRRCRSPAGHPGPLAGTNHGSGRGLTRRGRGSKLEGLPRRVAERRLVGVRPLLENSTACQKSMPNLSSFRGGGFVSAFGWVWGLLPRAIPLVEMDGLFTSAFVCSHDLRAPFGGFWSSQMSALPGSGLCGSGVVSCWSSTESLILAQDERWRRA